MKKLGQHIKKHRQRLGLRQSDVAHANDMDIREYQRIEAGERNLTLKTLFRVAQSLDCRLELHLSSVSQNSNSILFLNSPNSKTIPYFEGLQVAAGAFSSSPHEATETWIEYSKYGGKEGYFAVKITGDSMEPKVPHDSICVFKVYTGGSRQNKIMLFERLADWQEEGLGEYVIKKYSRKTKVQETQHRKNVLVELISLNKKYPPIKCTSQTETQLRALAEFIEVL